MKKLSKQSKFKNIQSFFNSSSTNKQSSDNSFISQERTVYESDLIVQIDSTFSSSQLEEQISPPPYPSASLQLPSPSSK
jgi:hypothetical protein